MEIEARGALTVADRIASETATRRRRPDYPSEVRALIKAARAVIEANGTSGRAKVSDIITEAGLSNETFYRHFRSKDALIAALIEDTAERVAQTLATRMADAPTAEGKVREWVTGMLAQGREASFTTAVLSNSSSANAAIPAGSRGARAPFANVLHGPFTDLGSANPALDADLVTDAVLGYIATHLANRTKPSDEDTEHILTFCLRAAQRR